MEKLKNNYCMFYLMNNLNCYNFLKCNSNCNSAYYWKSKELHRRRMVNYKKNCLMHSFQMDN